MSRSTNSTFTCPCGKVFTSPIYAYVNTAHDPQLQYTVLAGLLNVSTCPNCGRRAALARPFIYSDPFHALLAYVHPSPDVPSEARQLIYEKLRAVYEQAENVDQGPTEETLAQSSYTRLGNGATSSTDQSRELPDLQIVFGIDQLTQLINTFLSQDERLGRLALSTHSQSEAERGQLLVIARKFAAEMKCQLEVEELSDEYTVWLYGSRRQIGALMRELAPRG